MSLGNMFSWGSKVTHYAHHGGQVLPADLEERRGAVANHVSDVVAEPLRA